MANPEHRNLLRQGVDIWNKKRPDVVDLTEVTLSGVNLSEANLSGANLSGTDLSRANLSGANLSGANLSGTDLSGTDLTEANLSGANLNGANLNGANLNRANLNGANLRGANLDADLSTANLSETDLRGAKLSGAKFSTANLSAANLSETNLSEVNLNQVNLSGVNLNRANLIGANLNRANLHETYLSGANFMGANLREANLYETYLSGANLSRAKLIYANLTGANLSGADLSRADLRGADFNGANLSRANLSRANLRGVNLRGANLREANLSETDLSETDLNRAKLSGANFSKANFRASQALNTNFESTNLTGACIEDWNINIQTNLTNVICDYIYLKDERWEKNGKMIFTERRPSNPDENFAPGDFARLVQKTIETVDLIFRDGIEWKSFALSLQELNQEAKIKIASESDPLSIRAIETRDDGSFVIRVNIPTELDKGEIEKSFKQKYSRVLKAREEYYRRELQAKDSQIEIYRQHNTSLERIIDTLASKPININNMANNGDNFIQSGQFGIGQMSGGEIKDQAKIAGVLNEGQQNNLNMIKVEIDQILKPLLEKYPTNTTSEQMIVASQAIQQIENNPSLKTRLINAMKEGSLAALEQSLNHPVCSFMMNAVKGFKEAQ